jgi:AcrR family transcriptional regulator
MKVVVIGGSRSESDKNLAARFAREAEPLFEVLSRGARRLTRCDADAEDLLQETLLHAYAGFHTFQAGSDGHPARGLPDGGVLRRRRGIHPRGNRGVVEHPVARELVLLEGARAVTVDRIVEVSGAPKGSIYYRFSRVDDLLAAMWIRAVRRSQAAFLAELSRQEEPVEVAVAAGLAVCDFARTAHADARLLAAVRREDLVAAAVDAKLVVELLFGRATRETVEWTTCAVIDLPQGAIRRHLIAGNRIPDSVPAQLRAAIPAALYERGAAGADD